MITTTELLDFLCKAHKLCIFNIIFRQTDEGYKITLRHDWHGDGNNNYKQSIFIDNEGESIWPNGGDYDFYTMNLILDEMLEDEEEKKIKAQKRKELIARLTDEEKDLLDLK